MKKIKLIIIGHVDKIIDFDYFLKFKSKFFNFVEIERISDLPTPLKEDGYLNIEYSSYEIGNLLKEIKFDGICLAIMNYKFDDNFYLHRVGENKACISIYDINQLLSTKDISIENFIIKNTYKMYIFSKLYNNLNSHEVYTFVHSDTRGCLFDLNGDRKDIIYNTEKPIICDECKSKINRKSIPNNFIANLEMELMRIDKPIVKKVEIFIKRYPLISIAITFLFSTFINLISNWIWETVRG